MLKSAPLIVTALLVVALAGCNSSSNSRNNNDSTSQVAGVRVLHAVPDAPAVNVLVDGEIAFPELDYSEGGTFASVPVGTRQAQVDGILPGGVTSTVIGPVDLTLEAGREYTVLATGELADIEPLVIDAEQFQAPSGASRVQVVHAAPNAPAVDVYVTVPDADLSAEMPARSFAFREDFGPVELPAGEYQIRVTLQGDSGAVVFDSGPVDVADGGDLLLAAVENTGPGDAPIYLMALVRDDAIRIYDRDTPATLRAVHAVPDAPEVQVVIDDDFASPAVPGLEFPEFTGYLEVAPDTYNVKVTPSDNDGLIVIDADVELAQGDAYTLLAVGTLGDVSPLVLTDDNRGVATAAKVRIVHASPGAGPVDIYVTAPGDDINGLSPAVSNFPFADETGYLQLDAGTYDVTVTPAGSKTAAIGPVEVDLAAGSVYTAVARDAAGGGTPLDLILMDAFVP